MVCCVVHLALGNVFLVGLTFIEWEGSVKNRVFTFEFHSISHDFNQEEPTTFIVYYVLCALPLAIMYCQGECALLPSETLFAK